MCAENQVIIILEVNYILLLPLTMENFQPAAVVWIQMSGPSNGVFIIEERIVE